MWELLRDQMSHPAPSPSLSVFILYSLLDKLSCHK